MTNFNRRTFMSVAGIAATEPANVRSPFCRNENARIACGPDWKWRVDLRSCARLGIAAHGHELWGYAWRRRAGQCGQHLRQHTKRNRSAPLQPRWKLDEDHSKCVSRGSFDGSRPGARRGVLLRYRAERHACRELVVYKDEDRRHGRDEDHRSSGSRV